MTAKSGGGEGVYRGLQETYFASLFPRQRGELLTCFKQSFLAQTILAEGMIS